MRKCLLCGELKPTSEYYPSPACSGGLTTRCKDCLRASQRLPREGDPPRSTREYESRGKRSLRGMTTEERVAHYLARSRADSRRACPRYRAAIRRAPVVDAKACDAFIDRVASTPTIPCAWCGAATTPGRRHIDHIIPLSRGGPHCVDNLCVACPTCNMSKGASLPSEFTARRKAQQH